MHISDLPLELHVQITTLACTQLSPCPRIPSVLALSLVSTYWHSIAKPLRFHSIRVTGGSRISKLVLHLISLPESERRVRFLWLSDSPEEAKDEEVLKRRKTDIIRLLSMSAPSLYELELHLENPAFATSLFALSWELYWPHLVSLSIKGYYSFPTAPLDPSSSTCRKANFPLLERLSLDGVANPSGLICFGMFGCAFPKLVTLEVRGLHGALTFAREISEVVRERDERLRRNTLTEVSSCYLPRTLRSLLLFPSAAPARGYSKRGQTLDAEMLDLLVQLGCRDETGRGSGLQIVVGSSDHVSSIRS